MKLRAKRDEIGADLINEIAVRPHQGVGGRLQSSLSGPAPDRCNLEGNIMAKGSPVCTATVPSSQCEGTLRVKRTRSRPRLT